MINTDWVFWTGYVYPNNRFEILHGMLPEVYRKILKNLVKVEKKAKTKPTKEDESAAAKKSKR